MRSALSLGTLVVLAFVGGIRGEADLDLGDSDFDSKLASFDNALVMFYAPWCGHCKRLKPEFTKAAEILRDDDPPVQLVKVDCTEAGKETCNRFSVSGYPTLKIFKNGELSSDYNGPREVNGIVKFMRSQVGPASKELKSVSDYENFVSKDDVAIIAFLADDSKLEKTFQKVTDALREKARFAHASNEDILKKASQKGDTLVLVRPKQLSNKFESDVVVYDGAFDTTDIKNWITQNYHGLVGIRTQDSSKDFKQPLVVAYFNVDYKKNVKGTNYWRNRILKVAQSYKSDFAFAISNKDEFQYELNEYGIEFTGSDKPIVTAKNDKGQKFKMAEEFSVENLESFLKQLLAGELQPFLKSEPIPDNNEGGVTVAVAKNFDDVVYNSGKDALIEFYAPWCGHCKKLTPIYDELGEKLKEEEVAIVKMDATANDVPDGFDVKGFPTIYWLPKGTRKPIKYEGGREVEDFINYIAKEATNELKGYDRSGKPKEGKSEL